MRRSAQAAAASAPPAGERQVAPLDEVRDDREAFGRDDAAQTLDLDVRVDDDAVRGPPEPAQAPGVRLQPALAEPAAVEDVVQGHHERAAIGAPEAQQAQAASRRAVPQPAAVPLHDARPVRRASSRGAPPAGALSPRRRAPHPPRWTVRPRPRGRRVGDELAVAAHTALGAAEVQEPQVVQLDGHRGPAPARLSRRSRAAAGVRPPRPRPRPAPRGRRCCARCPPRSRPPAARRSGRWSREALAR